LSAQQDADEGKAYSIGLFVVSVIVFLTLTYWRVSGPVQVPSPRLRSQSLQQA
jgi:hypothetical protein